MKVKEIKVGTELKVKSYFWEGALTGLEINEGLTGTVDWISPEEFKVDFEFEYAGRDYRDYVYVSYEDMSEHFEDVEEWNEEQ